MVCENLKATLLYYHMSELRSKPINPDKTTQFLIRSPTFSYFY
jgi:hypothetical protein